MSRLEYYMATSSEREFYIPEGTRIALPEGEKKIEDVASGDTVLTAVGWGEVKPVIVTSVGRMVFDGYLACVETVGRRQLFVPAEHLLFTRVSFKGRVHLVCLTQNYDGRFHTGLFRGDPLENGPEDIERAWILKACRNRNEAAFFLGFYAFKYGLPYQEFSPDTFFLDPPSFERYMEEIDTVERARKLCRSEQIDSSYPHFDRAVSGGASEYKLLDLIMYGEREENGIHHEHLLYLNAPGHSGRSKNKQRIYQLPVDHPWKMRNVEVTKEDYGELLMFARTLASLDNVRIRRLSQLTVNVPFATFPASNVVSGMDLPGLNEGRIEEIKVRDLSFVRQSGPLFSIALDGCDNCILEDVVIPCRW